MSENTTSTAGGYNQKRRRTSSSGGASGGAYGLGFIGALVYFWQHADSVWTFILGFFEAIFWPAILVYQLLDHLKVG